jgi:hypothetical protein
MYHFRTVACTVLEGYFRMKNGTNQAINLEVTY